MLMVKETTTKKIRVTAGSSSSAAAKATSKAAKTTKTTKKTATKKTTPKKSAAKKTTKKSVASAVKPTPRVKAKPAPVPSPVRKVDEIAEHQTQFTGQWLLILLTVVAIIAGVAWWATHEDNSKDKPYRDEPASADVLNGSSDFQPTIRVVN